VSLDGCSSTCLAEDGWNCDGAFPITGCTEICGDGKVVGTETCDDGNKIDNIGCLADCTGEINGYHCSGGTLTIAATCNIQCGDNFISPGEQCEDGNNVSLDGCSSTCQEEDGYNFVTSLNATSHQHTVATPICGDGKNVFNEACDDGLTTDNKGCLANCTDEIKGWTCGNGSYTEPVDCYHTCGDGHITILETCEDGNTDPNDGCSTGCHLEPGWTHVQTNNATGHNVTVSTPICGDGLNVGTEVCDDGDETDSRGCKNDCSGVINGYTCTGGSLTTAKVCTETCGDKYITHSE
jgi:cysteine-rich repeat protein